ncbi:MAG TPA: helix-turn-helix transcriptional regulator [Candidatus Binataceae bacterium]|nr:helix-turn-helix transcriptional regulator [Candidatus Binataceae bacterium]
MITSQQMSMLFDLRRKPIPVGTLAYFRARLKDRFHALILDAFLKQVKEAKLNQKELAARIGRDTAQINRWLGEASNWTLDTISDLMVGMGVDIDDPSFTSFADLAAPAQKSASSKADLRTGFSETTTTQLLATLVPRQPQREPSRMILPRVTGGAAATSTQPAHDIAA